MINMQLTARKFREQLSHPFPIPKTKTVLHSESEGAEVLKAFLQIFRWSAVCQESNSSNPRMEIELKRTLPVSKSLKQLEGDPGDQKTAALGEQIQAKTCTK